MTTRCAVLGSPIGHSLSPVLHRAAYADLGLDWQYDACDVDEAGLEAIVVSTYQAVSGGGLAGVDELDKQVAQEQARYERLRVESAALESPSRIVEEAGNLGLVPAQEVTWLMPDAAQPGAPSPPAEDPDTSDTSWADVKPYLEPSP